MIKKDKIFELKIEEDDEISGIDSISLVSEPAIEINWVAFNKVKPESFIIPDGEDLKYSEMITQKGQSEEELLKDGWVVHSTKLMGKDEFITSSPNSPSFEDTDEYLVRYKYILNPEAPGAAVKETTRDFCRDLINKNYVYRVEDLDTIINDLGSSALVWRGSYNCRHLWQQIRYHKDTKIVNKGSVLKGRIQDAESLDVMGLPQPDTRVPSRPSFSKELFQENILDVFGYKTKHFDMCPGAVALFKHLVSMPLLEEDLTGMIRSAAVVADTIFKIEKDVIAAQQGSLEQLNEATVLVDDFKDIIHEIDEDTGMIHDVSFMDGHILKIAQYVDEDLGYDVGALPAYVDEITTGVTTEKFETYSDYPQSASNNACKVLRWREEHGDEVKGMTRVGWTRANQLCKHSNISEETIARMAAFARHRRNSEVAPEFKDTPWKDAGYVAWLGWGGTTGVEWASRKLETIRRRKMSLQRFATDEEQRVTIGPAMVPDLKIFRKDHLGNPYYVVFRADTIKMIAEKYMRNKYLDNNDTNHDGVAVRDVYVVESWIKEDEEDKANKYGFADLPVGTWFVKMKVAKTPEGDKVWEKIKSGDLRGYSVSGFFAEEPIEMQKEMLFLHKVAEILRNVGKD